MAIVVPRARRERHAELDTTTTSGSRRGGSFPLINSHSRVSECAIDER